MRLHAKPAGPRFRFALKQQSGALLALPRPAPRRRQRTVVPRWTYRARPALRAASAVSARCQT
jgi:hypothetical protein